MKFYITIMVTLLTVTLTAQVGVGSKEQVTTSPGKLDDQDLEKLKSSKTVFLYREGDDVEALEQAIKSVWTVTEISLLPHTDYDKIDFATTSVFSLGGFNLYRLGFSASTNYSSSYTYLNLWMKGENSKGKEERKSFCRIELHPTSETLRYVLNEDAEKAYEYLYTDATLHNWTPGFIRNYLKQVNDLLSSETERWLYQNEFDEEIEVLSDKTLYLPDYLFVKFAPFSGDESERLDEDDLLKNYPYDYEIISAEELSDKMLASEEALYYLVYVKSSSNKYLSIYNSKTGNLLYSSYKPMSYNVKKSDFKKIAKLVK